ncbi:plasmid replication protein [Xenorhabdus sp. PB30.3]|uniref:plasmid replication protein n=1 Tax=Xenorhabdus sp. PB30.3 TaxID=2788941 RepID=UPI001E64340E|nr:plasmid replication protein [Xenorhabdus sp. PB30.3]MCC8379131.1 plasmid replication protein [Xenorhabdus sp. PB30.3]
MARKNKDKDIETLNVTTSVQMSLFEILESPVKKDDYSNTIELYDALPKYIWDQRIHEDLSNAIVTRECNIRGQQFTIKIKPAIIEKDDGRTVLIYAGQREEILEDALRKLAVNGNGHIIEGKAGVMFTLYELKKELSKMGHTYSLTEIKEAIQICRGATLECISSDGEAFMSSSFFPMVGLTTRGEFRKKGGNAKCYVQFHILVNESIMNLSFRQYNYKIGMQIRSPLARYIYKRMSHYWTQAHVDSPYTPSLISFLSQSPRELSPRMPENVRAMKNALDVLIKQEVIKDYDTNQLLEGRKVIDVRYTIRPHEEFVKQVMASNKRKKQTELKVTSNKIKDINSA